MLYFILGSACAYFITILCWVMALKSKDYFIGFLLLICSFPCISAATQMHLETIKLKEKELQLEIERQQQLEIDQSQMQTEQCELKRRTA